MTVAAVAAAMTAQQAATGRAPGIIRTSRSAFFELTSDASVAHRRPPPDAAALLGCRVVIDPGLPAGAWRLCAADDTLLYDSREGTSC